MSLRGFGVDGNVVGAWAMLGLGQVGNPSVVSSAKLGALNNPYTLCFGVL